MSIAGELQVSVGIFGDDPPLDVPLWVLAFDVLAQLPASVEIPATEITAVTMVLR